LTAGMVNAPFYSGLRERPYPVRRRLTAAGAKKLAL